MKERAMPRRSFAADGTPTRSRRDQEFIDGAARTATRAALAITWTSQVGSAAMYLAALDQPAVRGRLFIEDPAFAVCLWASVTGLVLLWIFSLWGEQRARSTVSRRSHRKTGLASQALLLLASLAVTSGRPGWAAWCFDLLLLFLCSTLTWVGWMRCHHPGPKSPDASPAMCWQVPVGKHAPLVYFIRNGNRVKIGTTTELKRRIRTLALRAENVVLLLSGDRFLERRLHTQFADLRIGDTEWFVYEGAVADFIADQTARIAGKDQGK